MSVLDVLRLRRRVLENRRASLEMEHAKVLSEIAALNEEVRSFLVGRVVQVPLRMDHDDPRERNPLDVSDEERDWPPEREEDFRG